MQIEQKNHVILSTMTMLMKTFYIKIYIEETVINYRRSQMIELNPQTIDEVMDWISSISDKEGQGTTRLLYSPSWVRAQNALKDLFEELGMNVEFDEVGNLFATLEGSEEPESIIASGSHIDTVVDGGRLDGQLGIMSAYLAIKGLIETHGQPKKSLRILSMAEEEGSRFPYAFWGSKNIFGEADKNDVIDITDSEGTKFTDAMEEAGYNFLEGEPRFSNMDAFLELHIEQGNFLEMEDLKVGIVNAIVGQKRFTITLKGQANHAGTTLMKYRKDAVECMSRIIVKAIDRANEIGDPLVVTFGRVDVKPNVVNVVPGQVEFSMDMRHTDQAALDAFAEEIQALIHATAEQKGIEAHIDMWMDEPPVPMDSRIVSTLEKVCEEQDLDYRVMHSGAGHDSQIIAPHVPTAMIFVPSIDGISHNPKEHTEAVDIVQGIQALAEALKELAY